MSVFNAGDVAAQEAGSLFDVPLWQVFFLTQHSQTLANNYHCLSERIEGFGRGGRKDNSNWGITQRRVSFDFENRTATARVKSRAWLPVRFFNLMARWPPSALSPKSQLVGVGVNRHGQQFVVPVQAKGGSDKLGVTQTRQDMACCAQKFPHLTCRPVSAQFMSDDTIALFELGLQGDNVKIVEERHYNLVASDQITAEDLKLYSKR
jgi:hypothetical protein